MLQCQVTQMIFRCGDTLPERLEVYLATGRLVKEECKLIGNSKMAKKESSPVKAELIDPKEYGLEKKDVAGIAEAFAPKIAERDGFSKVYALILEKEEGPEQAKEARELRLKLVKTRTGIKAVHGVQKKFYKAMGDVIDAWKNRETLPVAQMEEVLSEIENRAAIAETKRLEALQIARVALLDPYVEGASDRDLSSLDEDYWDYFLDTKKKAYEAKVKKEQEEFDARAAEKKRLEEIASLNTSRQKDLAPLWSFMTEEEQSGEYGEQDQEEFDKFVMVLQGKKDESEKWESRKKQLEGLYDFMDDIKDVAEYIDKDFKKLVSDATKKKEAAEKAEAKRIADEAVENERLKKEAAASKAKAAKAEKEANAAKAKAAESEKEAATAKSNAAAATALASRNKERQQQLFDLGFEYKDGKFRTETLKVDPSNIPTATDAEWDDKMELAKQHISHAAEAEQNKPEIETFNEFLSDLKALKGKYEFEDKKIKPVFTEACGMIDRLVAHCEGKVK